MWFSTSPNLVSAYLDGVDVCEGGSTETTTTTTTTVEMPDGPQGPSGTILKVFQTLNFTFSNKSLCQYDLLSNSDPGITYPDTHIGAFVAQNWPSGLVNDEDQVTTNVTLACDDNS